jgi:hypothetical protein
MTGILTVGDTSGHSVNGSFSKVEPPRFVTPARLGDLHKYTITNGWGHLDGAFPATVGVVATEIVGATAVLTLDFTTVGGMVLDDGSGGGTGGILSILAVPGNAVVVNFYDPDPSAAPGTAYIGSLTLTVAGGIGVVVAYDAIGAASTSFVLAGSGLTLIGSDGIRVETIGAGVLPAIPFLTPGAVYDFTVTVDTYIDANTAAIAGLVISTGIGSTTCEIERDRLTFSEALGFGGANVGSVPPDTGTILPRGSNPANGDAIELGVQINIQEVTANGVAGSSVNEVTETNGGVPFTLQTRIGPDPDGVILPSLTYVATYTGGRGRLRMMAWEGHGNTPLPFGVDPVTDITVATVPSSDLGESAIILEGTGLMRDDTDGGASTFDGAFAWIDTVTASGGALTSPEAGDIVVVDGAGAGVGAVNCGTYLVRHVVDSNLSSADLTGTSILGGTFETAADLRQTLDFRFPRVKSLSGTTLVLKGAASVPHSPTDCGFPDTGSDWVYLILKNQYASYDSGTTTYTIDATSVYRAEYTTTPVYDASTGEVTITLSGTYEDATGAAITAAAFAAAAAENVRVSGMIYFPFNPLESTGLPPNNVVGWDKDNVFNDLTAGVKLGIFGNLNADNHGGTGAGSTVVTSKAWDKPATPSDIQRLLADGDTTTVAGSLGVRVPVPEDSTDFYNDRATSIYGRRYTGTLDDLIMGVAAHISFDGLGSTEWSAVHFDTGATIGANVLECLLPGDQFVFGNNLDPTASIDGFYALSGVFLEPSFPRPTTDLNQAVPHVVDNTRSAGSPSEVGHRNYSDFDTTASGTYYESVHFYVRRVRRWHGVQTNIASSIETLQYLYEMRQGDYGSYAPTPREFTSGSSPATNLGDFDDPRVNINSGDTLRILDADGNVIDSAEVQKVVSGGVLKLRKPGLTAALGPAVSFQVFLEQAIVPHEQSNQQLLELVTDQVVFRRTVDYGAGDTDGGEVPTAFNTMRDTLVTSWAAEGVQEGDYVIIDPAGTLYEADEAGARPLGDQAVASRAVFDDGAPNAFDDNRGFYRVATDPATTGADLEVDGASRFGGGAEDASDDVIFGDSATDSEYAVLPTISDSELTRPGGPFPGVRREGQQALRPTARPVGTSYRDRTGDDAYKSIEPFPYIIIRPCPVFSEDALELVLFMRERMLSLIEEARSIYQNGKGGDYYVFQRDDHIEDVGSSTDPLDGLGIISNGLIISLQGLVDTAPYANVSDCLSVLGRRFWILDLRLDALPASGPPYYTAFVDDDFGQRPVLPDLIDDVLNLDDRFRDLRYSWISFRADQVNGSIQAARRAAEQLPVEIQKQKELIDQRKALESDE